MVLGRINLSTSEIPDDDVDVDSVTIVSAYNDGVDNGVGTLTMRVDKVGNLFSITIISATTITRTSGQVSLDTTDRLPVSFRPTANRFSTNIIVSNNVETVGLAIIEPDGDVLLTIINGTTAIGVCGFVPGTVFVYSL